MRRLTKAKTLTGLGVIALVSGVVVIAAHGCGITPPRKTTMPVGASITLMPMKTPEAQQPLVNPPNIHIVVNFEGKLLTPADNSEILIYEQMGAEKPLYRFSTTDLVNAYKDTKCTQQLVSHLNNAMHGDGLFCNNALDLRRMRYFVLKTPGHEDETATSYIRRYDDPVDQVVSVVIPFM